MAVVGVWALAVKVPSNAGRSSRCSSQGGEANFRREASRGSNHGSTRSNGDPQASSLESFPPLLLRRRKPQPKTWEFLRQELNATWPKAARTTALKA